MFLLSEGVAISIKRITKKVSMLLTLKWKMRQKKIASADNVNDFIDSTVEYIIEHDKKEVLKRLAALTEEATEEYADTFHELEELTKKFLLQGFSQDKQIFPLIDQLPTSNDYKC